MSTRLAPRQPGSWRAAWLVMAALVWVGATQHGVAQQTSAAKAGLPPDVAAAVDRAVQTEMQRQELIGVAVGVLREGTVTYTQGYGLADAERRIPVTTRTVFNWASNSKPVVAVAAMQLVEKGLLDLEADVRSYVPEFPEKGATITVRHLLCHQSGLPHYSNGKVLPLTERQFPPTAELDPVVSIHRFGGSPLIFSPGSRYDYSSYAYVLLSAVVQRAGKQPLANQLNARILKPLGIDSFQLDMPANNQPFWASGYKKNGTGQVESVKDYTHFWKHGAGGYKSNVADFARWAAALLKRDLVSESSEQAMWSPQKTNDGQLTRYGLGFVVSGDGEDLRVSHGGSHEEVKTHLLIYPARKEGVVVMCNCGHAEPAAVANAVYQALK